MDFGCGDVVSGGDGFEEVVDFFDELFSCGGWGFFGDGGFFGHVWSFMILAVFGMIAANDFGVWCCSPFSSTQCTHMCGLVRLPMIWLSSYFSLAIVCCFVWVSPCVVIWGWAFLWFAGSSVEVVDSTGGVFLVGPVGFCYEFVVWLVVVAVFGHVETH